MQPATTLQDLKNAQNKEGSLPSVTMGFGDLQSFELTLRIANMLGSSTLVPKDYQNNIPNCAIALNMAHRIGADPLMVMQNLYIVHGRPGWSSQFLIAGFNSCKRFSSLRYEFFGDKGKDTWGCRAWAIELSTSEKIIGADITIAISKAEKWYEKNGSKWQTMPQQMLMYRAASFLIRAYAPEITMGLQTAEEIGDVYDAAKDDGGHYSVETLKAEFSTPVIENKPQGTMSYAEVSGLFHRAKSIEDLEIAGDLIRSVASEEHQKELAALYDARLNEIKK